MTPERPERQPMDIGRDYEQKYGFHDPEHYVFKSEKGLTQEIVERISEMKQEPAWMRTFRLGALERFLKKPMPTWLDPELLSQIRFDNIHYYLKATDKSSKSWEDVPDDIRKTYEKLGIPEAERKFLAGVTAQYECLSADTVVFANPRATAIKDLKPGDHVYSLNEATRQLEKHLVKAVVYKGERPVFEVKAGNRRIKCTENHPFYALVYEKAPGRQRGRFHAEWRYLSDLKPGDYIAVVKELPDDGQPMPIAAPPVTSEDVGRNQFRAFAVKTRNLFTRRQRSLSMPTVTSADLLWFLGLYLGDGYLRRGRATGPRTIVGLAIPAKDEPTRAKLQTVLREAFGYELRFDRDPMRARVHAKPIAELVTHLGLAGFAKTKQLPAWLFSLPRTQKLAFIAGYADADGYLRSNPKQQDVVITSANQQLLRDVQRLSITAGLHVSDVYQFQSTHQWRGKVRTHPGYRLLINGDLAGLAAHAVRCGGKITPRRYTHSYSSAHNAPIHPHVSRELGFARIKFVTPLGIEPVYDIEVDGPHNFVAEGIVVHNSEVVYHSIREDLQKQGVIFTDMDSGVREHPEIVQKYFATVIPPADNKFAALNSAVWSGGSFIYVPRGVRVEIPLQAYFRINAENMGQFERTLIIADEGASVHYIEGCLPAGEQVSTGERWVNIEAVRPEDTVLNSDGKEAKVRAVRARPFRGDLITIRPLSRGNAFQLTPEHPVLAVPREEVRTPRAARRHWLGEVNSAKLRAATPRFIEAGQLQRGDFLVFPIPQVVKDDPRYTVPVLRLLGYYLAEGSTVVHKTLRQPVVVFSFGSHQQDRPLVEEVKRLIQEVTGKRAIEVANRKNHGTSVLVYSHDLRNLCLESAGNGAGTKALSKTVMELPPAKQAHLLETYLLGDGSRYQERAHVMVRASTTSQILARQLQELLARQGHYATLSVRKGGADTILGRPIVRKDQYILYYAPDRAMGEVRRSGNAFLVPIKALERRRFEGPVFNIELDRAPNAYLARGFAVHNCTAPVYSTDSLHSAVVELIALPYAKIRYTTIQNWSKNVYNLVTKRAVAYEGATVEWIDGNLGCVRAGELVYTEAGPKPIETIEPGTRVWSFDEPRQQWQLRPVVAVKDSGLQQVYEVVFSNGRTLHLTDNHPLLAVHHDATRPSKLGRYSLRWTPLQQLAAGDLVVFPTKLTTESPGYRFEQPRLRSGFTNRNQYGASFRVPSHARFTLQLPEWADEDACWMLGLWITDGDHTIANGVHGTPRYGRVGWSVPREDRARNRLLKLLKRYAGNFRVEERRDGVYFRINSLGLALWLETNGLLNGAREKRVPGWVFNLPTTMQRSFLAGYLDGDGSAKATGLSAKSANHALLSDMQMLATLCGVQASAIYTEKTTLDINGTGKAKTYVGHRLNLSRVGGLRPYLSPGFRSRMREAKLLHTSQRPLGMRAARLLKEAVGIARITSIRATDIAPTYDLEVDGTCSFVVNGILVHNSKLTAKYPSIYLLGERAHGEVLSVAFAGKDQHQDAGAKIIHAAPNTTSTITSKSISKDGGRTTYRGLVQVHQGAIGVKSHVRCDALLLDERSRSDTYPTMEIDEKQAEIGHEASVSKVGEEQLFYLMSRGLNEAEATTMIVNGFFEPFAKELPLEYAVELNRLIQLEMEGSVG